MTAPEIRATLARLGLSQVAFRRHVEALGHEPLPHRTASAWATGERQAPPAIPALLALMERAPEAWRPTGVA